MATVSSSSSGTRRTSPSAVSTHRVQLRRRREAAKRLPTLVDGRRDPLDILVSYSREPLRSFWIELRDRGLLTDAITAELVRLAQAPKAA